ncbi:MAG: hypothetical protein R2822_26295 [Spirosomataceae bacterium]
MPTVLKNLSQKDAAIKVAAIEASSKIGQELAWNDLMNVLKKGSPAEIKAVKTALLTMKDEGVVNRIATLLPTMPVSARPTLIEVLAERAADDKIEVILTELKTDDTPTKIAAFTALKSVVSDKDLPTLFALLNTSVTPQEVEATQEAITVAIKSTGDGASQTNALLAQMNTAPSDKRNHYLRILANIGGKKHSIL